MRSHFLTKTAPALPPEFATTFLWSTVASLAYYAGAHIAFTIGTFTESFAPFWPPNTVLLCVFLFVPVERWPIYIAAVFPAHVVAELDAGMPWLQILLTYCSNVLVASLTAFLLLRSAAGPPWLSTLRGTLSYLFTAAVASPCLVAFLAAFEPILAGADPGQYWTFWWRWYLSNALGALTLTPIILTWSADDLWPMKSASRGRWVEVGLAGLALVATCMIAFHASAASARPILPALLYAPVPVLLWAAVRFGRKGASGASLIVAVMSIWYAMQGRGPFVGGPPEQSVLALQLFLIVALAPLAVLAAIVEEFRSVNSRMAGVLAGISDCYVTLDRRWRVTAINHQATSWLSASREFLANRVLPTMLRSSAVRAAMEGRSAAHVEQEFAGHKTQWIELHAYPSAEGLSVFFCDITKRKSAERAAQEKEALLQSTMDSLAAQIAILDSQGTIIAVNAAWHRFAVESGCAGFDLGIGSDYRAVCRSVFPEGREAAAVFTGVRRVLEGKAAEFRMDRPCRYGAVERWFQLRATRFESDAGPRLVLALEDVTEIKSAEASLRRLSEQLLSLQDDERRRIARELHDSTSQYMLGAALGIEQVFQRNRGLSAQDRTSLRESRELIAQSQREIRTISYLLHPPMLEGHGLVPALRDYVKGFARRSGIRFDLDIARDMERLPLEIENAFFRIVQESLTNVHRHSGSPVARVRLCRAGGRIVLCVADRGCGFGGAAAGGQTDNFVGVGIAGMTARMRQLGGRLAIRSGQWGTVVRATVPAGPRPGTASTEASEDVPVNSWLLPATGEGARAGSKVTAVSRPPDV